MRAKWLPVSYLHRFSFRQIPAPEASTRAAYKLDPGNASYPVNRVDASRTYSKGFGKNIVQRFPIFKPFLNSSVLSSKLSIGQCLHRRFQFLYFIDYSVQSLLFLCRYCPRNIFSKLQSYFSLHLNQSSRLNKFRI